MKSGEGGLGARREGVVGDVGVCEGGGLRGAEPCRVGLGVSVRVAPSDKSMGVALQPGVEPVADLPLPWPPPVLDRAPLRLRKW